MRKLLLSVCIFSVAFSFAQSSVKLKFNLEKGKVNVLKANSVQHVQSTVNGTTYNTEVDTRTSVSFKLLSLDKDIMSLEFRFDTVYSKTISPAGVKETNSAIPAKSNDYMGLLLNKYSQTPIIAKISTSGKFIGFENFRKFHDALLVFMDSIPENKKNQVQTQVDMLLKESTIQTSIEPMFAYLPESKVKVGEQWENTCAMVGGGMNGMTFNTYKLESFNKDSAQLSLTSELESIPSTEEIKNMSIDLKGTSTGNLTVDVKTGLIIHSTEVKNYKGVLTVNNNGKEMKIPMVLEATTKYSQK